MKRKEAGKSGECATTVLDAASLLAERAACFLRLADEIVPGGALSADAIHDTRVAGRRLIAAIRFFEPLLHADAHGVRRKVRKAIRVLNGLRDGDVLKEHLQRFEARHPREVGLACAEIDRRRELLLDGAGHDFQKQLHSGVRTRLEWLSDMESLQNLFLKRRAGLRALYLARWRSVAGDFEEQVKNATPGAPIEALHRLRIAGKRLRYTLELILPEDREKANLLRQCKRFQDSLGRIHDLQVAADFVAAFAAVNRSPADPFALLHAWEPPPAGPDDWGALEREIRVSGATVRRSFHRIWPSNRICEFLAGCNAEVIAAGEVQI
jgi:CHAD domain-containing protein